MVVLRESKKTKQKKDQKIAIDYKNCRIVKKKKIRQ